LSNFDNALGFFTKRIADGTSAHRIPISNVTRLQVNCEKTGDNREEKIREERWRGEDKKCGDRYTPQSGRATRSSQRL
jgi:hypothetical protein